MSWDSAKPFRTDNRTATPLTSNLATGEAVLGLVSGAEYVFTNLNGSITAHGVATGKSFLVNNSLTLAGTDSTTMTFPTTSATIARTDAGQTFTGTQVFGAITATTINSLTITTSAGTLTIANNASASLITSGNFALTLTSTATTNSTFPAGTDTLMGLGTVQTVTGAKTFNAATLKQAGAGAGVATLAYANTATNSTLTLPTSASDTLAALGLAQTFSALQTFTGGLTVTTTDVTITDRNVALSATTGTKFGTATTQKLSLWNATPITQPTATTDMLVALQNVGLIATGTTPLSVPGLLTSQAGRRHVTANKTSAATATTSDEYFTADATTGAFNITLPAATGSGQRYVIKKTDSTANAIGFLPNGTDTIDGVNAAKTTTTQFASFTVWDSASGKWSIE